MASRRRLSISFCGLPDEDVERLRENDLQFYGSEPVTAALTTRVWTHCRRRSDPMRAAVMRLVAKKTPVAVASRTGRKPIVDTSQQKIVI